MKNFVKYLIIGAIIYYAYKYYKENFSKEAKAEQEVNEQEKAVKIQELKAEYRTRWHGVCVIQSQGSPFLPAYGEGDSPVYNACIGEIDNKMNNVIDWEAYYISATGNDTSYFDSLQP